MKAYEVHVLTHNVLLSEAANTNNGDFNRFILFHVIDRFFKTEIY